MLASTLAGKLGCVLKGYGPWNGFSPLNACMLNGLMLELTQKQVTAYINNRHKEAKELSLPICDFCYLQRLRKHVRNTNSRN